MKREMRGSAAAFRGTGAVAVSLDVSKCGALGVMWGKPFIVSQALELYTTVFFGRTAVIHFVIGCLPCEVDGRSFVQSPDSINQTVL